MHLMVRAPSSEALRGDFIQRSTLWKLHPSLLRWFIGNLEYDFRVYVTLRVPGSSRWLLS
jgi:hypothetical protein